MIEQVNQRNAYLESIMAVRNEKVPVRFLTRTGAGTTGGALDALFSVFDPAIDENRGYDDNHNHHQSDNK
jgi:hypothetical protein